MVVLFVVVGQQQPDKMGMPSILAAESFEAFDLLFVVLTLLGMKSLDSEVGTTLVLVSVWSVTRASAKKGCRQEVMKRPLPSRYL